MAHHLQSQISQKAENTAQFTSSSSSSSQNLEPTVHIEVPKTEYQIRLTESDKELLRKLDMEHRAKLVKQAERTKEFEVDQVKKKDEKTVGETINESQAKVTAVPNPKAKLKVRMLPRLLTYNFS